MCSGRVDALISPQTLESNVPLSTWSDGVWGEPCGWYAEYSWSGSHGGVYFELYSQNSIFLAV